jgi:hypothetical protein
MLLITLLIAANLVLTYLLLVIQPTFHRQSIRYLGEEIIGFEVRTRTTRPPEYSKQQHWRRS